MDSTASMPALPEDHCASQYNVGTLDAIGVTIVWFTVFRWILFVARADDINILFCLPNPKRRGSSKQMALLHRALFVASPIYTIVQAANCRDHLMKLIITTMVFLFILAKDLLFFDLQGQICGITFPDIIAVAAGAVAITEGALYVMNGPSALKLTVLYPVFLATFVTALVKGHGQWIPRPSTVVEYVMLATRCVAGFGGVDVLGAICSKIYRHIVPEVEECPDVEPGFNWLGALHAVGVAIVWFTILRWTTHIVFGDDLNILLGLRDRKRRGKGSPTSWIHLILLLASPIYTIVQAANCRDKYMKLHIIMMVFLIIYEQIFCLAKSGLTFEFLGHCCEITSPDIMLVATGAVAIAEGGQWRTLGITAVVVFGLLSNSIFGRQVSEGDKVYLIEAAAIKFTIIYPAILTAFFTMLVGDHGVQIPKPESAVECIMLDVLAAIVSSIYRLVIKDAKACPDAKPFFNWYSIRLGGIFGQGDGELEFDMS
ncbi:hypothetical protein BGX30_012406 [Mortierella sp. GBA39]|nr:hypothetical protein BGX30_012406 [Mortierella sp. GBA39]